MLLLHRVLLLFYQWWTLLQVIMELLTFSIAFSIMLAVIKQLI